MNTKQNDELSKFFGVDLHVHTPASSVCYKGEKSDSEYLEILRKYIEKEIKVIAITDHNTLKGYKKILQIKNELLSKRAIYQELIEKYPNIKEEYDSICSTISLFDKLLILPGIEFEANPGIHLLLIFDTNVDIDKVENFLIDAGYSEDIQGKENPGILPKYDVLDVLNEIDNLNGIVIASHADSKKGIYNSLEANQYRANIFRSDKLTAISYNSALTCQKMKSLLQNKEYKRQTPIAFIQCSDYHGGENAADCITYLKLEDISYKSIINALKNPNECVSPTQRPEVINILQQTIRGENTFVFKDLEDENDQVQFKNIVCALLNDGYGTVVIGAITQPEIGILGVSLEQNSYLEFLHNILQDIKPGYKYYSTFYDYGSSKYVLVIQIESTSKSTYHLSNDEVYIIKNQEVTKASVSLIEEMVEKRLFSRMSLFQQSVKNKLEKVQSEIEILKDSSQQFYLINKLEKQARTLRGIVDVKVVEPFTGNFEVEKPNGNSEGNVYFVSYQTPRLDEAYLRCTCPRTKDYDAQVINAPKFRGQALVMVPGGGVYYVDSEDEWALVSLCGQESAIVITIKENYKKLNISLLSLLGWLKSSLLLWYSCSLLNDANLHNPNVYRGLIIPTLDLIREGNNIESFIKEIIEKEYLFLSHCDTCDKCGENPGKMCTPGNVHNCNVEILAAKIDEVIYNELDVKESDRELINQLLEHYKIYCLYDYEDSAIELDFDLEAANSLED